MRRVFTVRCWHTQALRDHISRPLEKSSQIVARTQVCRRKKTSAGLCLSALTEVSFPPMNQSLCLLSTISSKWSISFPSARVFIQSSEQLWDVQWGPHLPWIGGKASHRVRHNTVQRLKAPPSGINTRPSYCTTICTASCSKLLPSSMITNTIIWKVVQSEIWCHYKQSLPFHLRVLCYTCTRSFVWIDVHRHCSCSVIDAVHGHHLLTISSLGLYDCHRHAIHFGSLHDQ